MQFEKPKVTVVTITYNLLNAGRKDTFLQCVESVKNQTYKNIEHIIIDGASSDGTLDLIKSTGLKYFSEPDDGIYFAMNKGIEKATGKYVVFLNSDDFWHEIQGIEKSVLELEKYNADFCYSSCLYISDDDEAMGMFPPVVEAAFYNMPFSHQTMLTTKDALINVGMFDTAFKSASDYDLVLKLCLSGAKSVELPYCFTTFRMGGISHLAAEFSVSEVYKILLKHYSHLEGVDETVCEKMHAKSLIPSNVYDYVLSRVNVNLRNKIVKCKKKQCKKCNSLLLAPRAILKKIQKFKLFNKITILSTEETRAKKQWLLFGAIPIFRIKYKRDMMKYYLLNYIPIFWQKSGINLSQSDVSNLYRHKNN